MSPLQAELYDLVRAIPFGRCTGYGALGSALSQPVSGLIVGRWMHSCPADAPWWRVVGANGALQTYKRDPALGMNQEARLREEGIPFDGNRVELDKCRFDP